MKNVIAIISALILTGCAANNRNPPDLQNQHLPNQLHSNQHQPANHVLNANTANDQLTRTGIINSKELLARYSLFKQSYADYQVDANEAKNFAKLKNIEFYVFFGLWCHDSQREVPRLIKLLKAANLPMTNLHLVAIPPSKLVPSEYSAQFNVAFTPTIFATKEGQILAKIIEKPKMSIAKDLLSQILH